MDLRTLFEAIWRRRLLVVAVLALDLLATVFFLVTAPKSYTAEATISAAPNADVAAQGSVANVESLQATVAQTAITPSVLNTVSARLVPVTRSFRKLRGEVKGSLVPGTVLIRVKVVDESPTVAADIANAVAAELPKHDPSAGILVFSPFESATPPTSPSAPKAKLVLAVGLVLGAALAFGAALLRDNAARRVETADDVQNATGAAVLTRVPRPRDASGTVGVGPDQPGAASFRALRIALEFVAAREPLPALVVTSAVPDDSEGWLAANLAIALAQVQHRVLLVDGNLEEPGRHPVIDAPGAPGLAEVLQGAETEPLLRRGPVDGLYVLPAGNAPLDAAQLVETRFGEVLLGWNRAFDVVVIDAPAVSTSDDARVMSVAGAVLLTVPAARVAPRTLRDVAASLRVVNARVAGAVLVGGDPEPGQRRSARSARAHAPRARTAPPAPAEPPARPGPPGQPDRAARPEPTVPREPAEPREPEPAEPREVAAVREPAAPPQRPDPPPPAPAPVSESHVSLLPQPPRGPTEY
jgi:Mrp family chromosome partitioning ATPase